MRGRSLGAGAALALAVVVGVPATEGAAVAGPPQQTPGEILRAGVQKVQADDKVIGAIGMVRNGDTAEYAQAGLGDAGNKVPADAHAKFRIGSNTKAFTATVLLQLEAEHRLSIDDTVDRWLPGVVNRNGNDGTKITIRQLLNHTSGLQDYAKDANLSATYTLNLNPDQHWDPRQLVDIATSQAPQFAPGTGWYYSNTNYMLAGMVITAVTGNQPSVEVQKRIIEPLGLKDTTLPATDPKLYGNFLRGYFHLHGGIFYFNRDATFSDVQVYGTAGAIVSTLDDLTSFARALVSGRLLPPAQQAELETTVPTSSAEGAFRYGLGIGLSQTPCGPVWWHSGLVLGYQSEWFSSPDGSRQAAMAINEYNMVGSGPLGDLSKVAMDAYCATGRQ